MIKDCDMLTKREDDVAEVLKRGFNIDETAKFLDISSCTAKTHRNNIYQKMCVNCAQELLIRLLNPDKKEVFYYPGALTLREADVYNLLCSGFSYKDCAKALVTSETTIKTHVNSIYKKLNVHSVSELIAREFYADKFRVVPSEIMLKAFIEDKSGYKVSEMVDTSNEPQTLRGHLFAQKATVNGYDFIFNCRFGNDNALHVTYMNCKG